MPEAVIPEKLYGVIGHPLAQTLSPLLHNWGFARLGINAAYLAFKTPPERLEAFIRAVRTLPIAGVSITIPHKEAVMLLLDGISDAAGRAFAVNTLVWEDGRLVGHNTDITGFVAPLLERREPLSRKRALVLGAGGAAKAVLAGLEQLDIADVVVANRALERAEKLAAQFGVRAVPWEERVLTPADLVVNATPMGMKGKAEDESPLPPGYWKPGHVAYDLIYNPRTTLFLRQAREANAQTIDGLTMFAAQGAAQFKLWTGRDLPLDEARSLLARALYA